MPILGDCNENDRCDMTLICLDTNAWYSESLLHSAVGSAVIYLATSQKHKLLFPDIVARELEHLTVRSALEHLDDATESIRQVHEMLGTKGGYFATEVSEESLRNAFRKRLHNLSPILQASATSDQERRAAFDRIVECRLPNSPKNQQAKDSLLWEHLLSMPTRSRVQVVTNDNAFYEGGTRESKSLATSFAKDASDRNIEIEVFRDCSSLLEANHPAEPNIDSERIRDMLAQNVAEILRETVATKLRGEPAIATAPNFTFSVFLTADPNILAIVLTIKATLIEEGAAQRPITISAQGAFDIDKETAGSFEVSHVQTPRHQWVLSRPADEQWLDAKPSIKRAPRLLVPLDRIRAGLKPK